MSKGKRIEFPLPENFKVPQGVVVGDDFDSLATLRLKQDGGVCLVELDGSAMPGYSDSDKGESDGSYTEAAGSRYEAAMKGP